MCQAQGEKNSFKGQGKNLIFERICRSQRVASNSAFHEVCVRSGRKVRGKWNIFFETDGNLSRIFVNWLIYFSICSFSSVGEFQRLVSESTGFIFYGPERFLGCMPPNMLAPMNITGNECTLTMSEWFHARWLDKTKLWSVGFRQWKCRNDGAIYYSVSGPWFSQSRRTSGLHSILPIIHFVCPPQPPHPHPFYMKFLWQNCSLFLYLLPGASFVFYNVCVCLVSWIILY